MIRYIAGRRCTPHSREYAYKAPSGVRFRHLGHDHFSYQLSIGVAIVPTAQKRNRVYTSLMNARFPAPDKKLFFHSPNRRVICPTIIINSHQPIIFGQSMQKCMWKSYIPPLAYAPRGVPAPGRPRSPPGATTAEGCFDKRQLNFDRLS